MSRGVLVKTGWLGVRGHCFIWVYMDCDKMETARGRNLALHARRKGTRRIMPLEIIIQAWSLVWISEHGNDTLIH